MFHLALRRIALRRWAICLVAPVALAVCVSSTAAAEKPRSERLAAKKSGASTAVEAASSYNIPQVEIINKQIRQGWLDNELTPSGPATDEEWCRRVHLDIIGRIPTVDELQTFLKNKSAERKVELVNKLLGEDYVEDYARNWTTIWTNVLIGRTGGTEERSLINRPGMQQYLRRTFQRNKSYDRMVLELITASGSTVPGEEDFNGATNFLVGKYEEKAAQATAKTSQIFLGLQVQCTQCHNHPFNDWKQNQFWEMNAFFRQSRPLRSFEGREIAKVHLVDEAFEGEDAKDGPAKAVLFYELRNGLLKAAYPVFVDGTSLVDVLGEETGNSGYLEDVIRRQELAKMMLKSPYLDKAIVNRYWAHFLGYGFTKPIDDMGPHNPPTHPELVAALGSELRNHSFDLKQLIRWITLSEAYSLSSKMNANNKKDDPTLGEKPMFSHFYLRQMQAEELYESLIVATDAQKAGGSDYESQEKTKRQWLQQFSIAFGTDEGDEATTFNGTIPQVLMLMNGELINKATSGEKGSFLDRVANNGKLNNSDKINYLYMAALARKPSKGETGWANQLLLARKGDVVAALQDIWWVLLNTNEFIFNH
jgi:hypothetical protein